MGFGAVHKTIGEVLRDQAGRMGSKTFLKYYEDDYSYEFLDSHTNRVGNGLATVAGAQKGDHVAVMLPNCPEFLWSIFGIGKLGAVGVPVNTAAKGDLLKYFLTQSDSSLLILHSDFLDRLEVILQDVPAITKVIMVGDIEQAQAKLPVEALGFDKLENGEATEIDSGVRYYDPHLIMYTSGTTGPSKGVVSPHAQGISVGSQVSSVYGYASCDVLYTCLPLFHANALWYSAFPALLSGATLAVSKGFSASRFWGEIIETGATQVNSLGAMTNIIMKELDDVDTSRVALRQCMVVPGLDEKSAAPLKERLGVKITSLFAHTETFAVTLFAGDSPQEKLSSAGKAYSYVDVRIVDEQDRVLPAREVGEIVVRPNEPTIMMLGYYKMAQETLKSVANLWFHSGDHGYLDEDGYLYFIDRKKDAIRRRGENISAYELEMIVSNHAQVKEVAAIAVPSDLSEDDVMAFVVPNPGEKIDYKELIEFCDRNLPFFMVPRYLHVIDELPKTPSEKIEKYKLREWAKTNLKSLWDREQHDIQLNR